MNSKKKALPKPAGKERALILLSKKLNTINQISKQSHLPGESRILAFGVDKIYLVISITWKKTKYTDLLHDLEDQLARAKSFHKPMAGNLVCKEHKDPWYYNIQEYSTKNYRYLLISHDYTVRIAGNSDIDYNVYVEVRSEILWSLGYKQSVERIINYLKAYAVTINIGISSLDLCADIETPETIWTEDLRKKVVTRATKIQPVFDGACLEGIIIGKGKIIARLYDKVKELNEHSKKYWMYEIWCKETVRPGFKIIRVEFQLRGSVLKTVLINSLEDLYEYIDDLWSYLTKTWLKFLVRPEKNEARQIILPWWKLVQSAFGKDIEPLKRVRLTAVRLEQDDIAKRTLAYLINLRASDIASDEGDVYDEDHQITLESCLEVFKDYVSISNEELNKRVMDKVINFRRCYG